MQNYQAKRLPEILNVTELKPLNHDNFQSFFVETDQARGKNIALHLKYYFESKKDTPQKVLFMGHRGSGKSTELFRLEQFLGHAFKLVRFSIKEVDIIDFNYIDLIFLLLDKLYKDNDKTPLPDSDLRALLNCMAVIKYNGQRWCGLHPAVIRMLEERGLTCISK
ncbi:MAG: hypothetical protein OMM_08894 [Candidatus Magnetoglobus multicellularis str. Araruama]|uniref:Uncharacterized protein n=1 Tax=Candidatus Magnetoglobus multicellularis str. Araruama TaxID=890399 RepID=A0A1V1P6A6_9BACT|nr:MAG: hypothetical protein OMM_08894 [Candidatus Magnetoglobus multicellularis str. Araruama]